MMGDELLKVMGGRIEGRLPGTGGMERLEPAADLMDWYRCSRMVDTWVDIVMGGGMTVKLL